MNLLVDCRLYAFVDSAYLHNRTPADLAQQLCDGGADLIQLRAKNWPEERIRKTAETLHPITHPAGVRLVINDHWARGIGVQELKGTQPQAVPVRHRHSLKRPVLGSR